MFTLINKRFWGMIVVSAMVAFTAHALSTSHYAKTSRLAQGKWVKIAIPTDGVYEITDAELAEMGFSNPENVRVYGIGGHVISEVLDGSAPDDLQQVSTARYNGKLCFYANGVTTMTIADPRTTMPYYTRTLNTYSTRGYYFLTEGGEAQVVESQEVASLPGTNVRSTCLDYYMHESEKFSIGYSGKTMLGENLIGAGATFDYNLPGIADPTLTVNLSVAANVTSTAYAEAYVKQGENSHKVEFSLTQSKILAPTDTREYYKQVSPKALVTPTLANEQGKLQVKINCPMGAVNTARLDYFIITYKKNNVILEGNDNQAALGFTQLSVNDRIQLPGASASTVVWRVDYADDPTGYDLSPIVDEEGVTTGYEFSPRYSSKASQFVAFDPAGTLKKIDGYEVVENQNLHGMATPHMLIITNKMFMPEAQRIADLHKTLDNLDVAVVDQEQVFNEFSSGTPDAMAYRMMCKMFYDRDKSKFKYLLLFGHGSYDNRGLVSNKPNRLLTYQSLNSDNQDYTYTSDDFFGLLDDNSGSQSTINNDMLRLGVGRYPVANLDEAKSDVDKLIKYVSAPDYGAWRNNALVVSDEGDDDLHMFQAEGISNLIENSELNTQLNTNKVYLEMFQKSVSDGTTSSEARRRMLEMWQTGQYFNTYIGHAGPLSLTKSKLWTSTLTQNTKYPHLPIMTTACCEVARFDSDERGIAEHMFHNPDGGAIALVTSTRQSYSDQNDIMNSGFIKGLFSYVTKSAMPTLGQAYMMCKQNFGSTTKGNKLSYVLLGDPAIKINYPKPLFNITSVNDNQVTSETQVGVSPMQNLTVTAQVLKADGSGVDTDFNGDATLSLYDAKRFFKHTTQIILTETVERDVYYPRDELGSVQGRVVNGQFTGNIVVPRYFKAQEVEGNPEKLMVRVYAHRDNSDDMVNGAFDNLTFNEYNEETAIIDNVSPVVDAMFLNEAETFATSNVVPANSTLYIKASDNVALNTQITSVGNSMKLLLDGGKTSYTLIKESAVATDGGRELELVFPIEGLSEGLHTLTFTVFDAAGNSGSHTISFFVAPESNVEFTQVNAPAVESVSLDIAKSTLPATPSMIIKVTDAQGNLVWSQATDNFPASWNLTDMAGNRVKAGVYKYFGTYNDGTTYGGTAINDVIVIDSVKSNKQ